MKQLLLALAAALPTALVHAQQSAERYAALCAGCHTPDPQSFHASALVTRGSDAEVAAVIRTGRPARGMPSFAAALDDTQARALAGWLRTAATVPATPTMVGRRIEAEDLRPDRSAGYGITQEGDARFLQWIDRGSHLCYDDVDLTGVRSLEYRYAKGEGEPPRRFAVVAFEGDFASGRRFALGEKTTELTGGWTTFRVERIGLAQSLTGRYRLCLIGMGGGGVFNLDHFTLSDVPGSHDGITQTFDAGTETRSAGGHAFRLEKVAEIDGEFWSMDFLDARTLVATQKSGALWLFTDGKRSGPIRDTPAVMFEGQGGLFAVRAHPEYRRNGWIYLTYAEPRGRASMLTIVRGRIHDGRWTDEQTIYRATPDFFQESGAHYGGRIVFDRGHLFFGVGDRGKQDQAQDLRLPFGKIHRIFDDGRIPTDNPFAQTPGALPTIWTYGHRNPQGLVLRGRELWSTEHGPKGGDELNEIQRGRNYGWPLVTFGINYDGTPVSADTTRPGLEPPRTHWSPSPGLSNLVPYEGAAFPAWRGHLLVSSLAHQQLKLVKLDGGRVTGEERLLDGSGRIRDVVVGPDGLPYVALNQPNGQIYRLKPVVTPAR